MYVKFRKPYDYVARPGVSAGPFFVDISAASVGQFELQLCTQCSRSYSHFDVLNEPNLHLLPRWRFVDKNNNPIQKISVDTTPVYVDDILTGVSGTAEFYYIDDMHAAPRPVYLMAELKQTKCLSSSACPIPGVPYLELDGNETVSYDVVPLWLNPWIPRYIKITKDGLNDVTDRWKNLAFNWVATLHDDVISNCDASKKDPIAFNYLSKCYYDSYLNKGTNFNSGLICPISSYITHTDASTDRLGGFTRGTITPLATSNNALISGTMFASYTAERVYPNLPVYISNPNNNTLVSLNRIPTILKPYLFHKYDPTELCNFEGSFEELMGTGAYWTYSEFGTPYINSSGDNVMGLSGFGGIYGIAVARQYDCGNDEYIWAADAEQDKVYKISADGSILKTIDFNYIDGSLVTPISATSSININISSKAITGTYLVNLSSIPTQTVDECIHFNLTFPATGIWLSKFEGAILEVNYKNSSLVTIASATDIIITNKPYNKQFTFEDFSGIKNIEINIITESENEHLIREIDLRDLTFSEIFSFTAPDYYQCPYRGVTPASVALDSDYNLWVSLFDSNKIYKFTSQGDKITSISLGSDVIPYPDNINQFGEDVLFKPAIVETDTEDNIWVGYNNSLSSTLIKYDGSTYTQLSSIIIASSATPVDLLIDGIDNSLWVSLAYSNQSYGSINHYSSAGYLLHSETVLQPSNITIDKQRRLWFIYDHNKVSCISPIAGENYDLAIEGNYGPEWYDAFDRTKAQLLEGIACDYNNNLWIIDSRDNYGLSLNLDLLGKPTSGFVKFKINPDSNQAWYNDTLDGSQYVAIDPNNKSAQAFCDWTGYRWWQKYIKINNNVINSTISGTSNVFKIKDFSSPFEFRKFNDSWDATNQIREYSIAPHIYSNYNLWENFIGSAVGGREYGRQLGRTVYEKIANYVPNHVDIDECEIRSLYGLAQYLDVPIDSYNIAYPPFVQRVMDLISINQSNLWGEEIKCNLNITDKPVCPRCNYRHTNLGNEIFDPLSYIVTANNPIVVHDRFIKGQYGWQLLNTPLMVSAISGSQIIYNPIDVPTEQLYYDNCNTFTSSISNVVSSYPLSSLLEFSPYEANELSSYDFYEYINGFPYAPDCDPLKQKHAIASSVINWNDTYNTLERENSSVSAWDSSIGNLLEYELLKGLQVLTLNVSSCVSDYIPFIPSNANLYGYVDITSSYYKQVCVNEDFTLKAYAARKSTNNTMILLSAFEWYHNSVLASTITGVSAVDTNEITVKVMTPGQHVYSCKITDLEGNNYIATITLYAIGCPKFTSLAIDNTYTSSLSTYNTIDANSIASVNISSIGLDSILGYTLRDAVIWLPQNTSGSYSRVYKNTFTSGGILNSKAVYKTGETFIASPSESDIKKPSTLPVKKGAIGYDAGQQIYWLNESTNTYQLTTVSAFFPTGIPNNTTRQLSAFEFILSYQNVTDSPSRSVILPDLIEARNSVWFAGRHHNAATFIDATVRHGTVTPTSTSIGDVYEFGQDAAVKYQVYLKEGNQSRIAAYPHLSGAYNTYAEQYYGISDRRAGSRSIVKDNNNNVWFNTQYGGEIIKIPKEIYSDYSSIRDTGITGKLLSTYSNYKRLVSLYDNYPYSFYGMEHDSYNNIYGISNVWPTYRVSNSQVESEIHWINTDTNKRFIIRASSAGIGNAYDTSTTDISSYNIATNILSPTLSSIPLGTTAMTLCADPGASKILYYHPYHSTVPYGISKGYYNNREYIVVSSYTYSANAFTGYTALFDTEKVNQILNSTASVHPSSYLTIYSLQSADPDAVKIVVADLFCQYNLLKNSSNPLNYRNAIGSPRQSLIYDNYLYGSGETGKTHKYALSAIFSPTAKTLVTNVNVSCVSISGFVADTTSIGVKTGIAAVKDPGKNASLIVLSQNSNNVAYINPNTFTVNIQTNPWAGTTSNYNYTNFTGFTENIPDYAVLTFNLLATEPLALATITNPVSWTNLYATFSRSDSLTSTMPASAVITLNNNVVSSCIFNTDTNSPTALTISFSGNPIVLDRSIGLPVKVEMYRKADLAEREPPESVKFDSISASYQYLTF